MITGRPSRAVTALLSLALLGVLTVAASCRTSDRDDSALEGFSASSSAGNVAVLMTAYGSTPGMAGLFETDMAQIKQVISDPAGNYAFNTTLVQAAGHNRMLQAIKDGASRVSEDGTLMVFITAHGATNGTLQPNDQAYATLGYSHILGAIREGRAGKKFRRLVLFISACYSGSWMSTLQSSDLFGERLVMTSVGPNELSMIGNATRSMLSAFQAHKDSKTVTMSQFFATTRQYSPSMMVVATPTTLLSEPLVNPSDGSVPPYTPPEDKVQAITAKTGAETVLFAYSTRDGATIEVWSEAESRWLPTPKSYASQDAWPTVRGLSVSDRWTTVDSVKLKVTTGGESKEFEVALTHQ
jgi:hypothetical protein